MKRLTSLIAAFINRHLWERFILVLMDNCLWHPNVVSERGFFLGSQCSRARAFEQQRKVPARACKLGTDGIKSCSHHRQITP